MDSEEATNTWRANPSLLVLLNAAWLAANTHFIVFSLIRLELEPTIYHSLEASTITITPPMWHRSHNEVQWYMIS